MIGRDDGPVFGTTLEEMRELSRVIGPEAKVAWTFSTNMQVTAKRDVSAREVIAEAYRLDYFGVLKPLLVDGRYPSSSEECAISSRLADDWGGNVIGAAIRRGDRTVCTISAVTSPAFRGTSLQTTANLWLAADAYFQATIPSTTTLPSQLGFRQPDFVATSLIRLTGKPAQTVLETARTRSSEISHELLAIPSFGIDGRDRERAKHTLGKILSTSYGIFFVSVCSIILLVVARVSATRRSFEIKNAIGASRRSLAREQMSEALVLWIAALSLSPLIYLGTRALLRSAVIPRPLLEAFEQASPFPLFASTALILLGALFALYLSPAISIFSSSGLSSSRSAGLAAKSLLRSIGLGAQAAAVTWVIALTVSSLHAMSMARSTPSGINESNLYVVRIKHTIGSSNEILDNTPLRVAMQSIRSALHTLDVNAGIAVMSPAPFSDLTLGELWGSTLDRDGHVSTPKPLRTTYIDNKTLDLVLGLRSPSHNDNDNDNYENSVVISGSLAQAQLEHPGVPVDSIYRLSEKRGATSAKYYIRRRIPSLQIVNPWESDPPTVFLPVTRFSQVGELVLRTAVAPNHVIDLVSHRLKSDGILSSAVELISVRDLKESRLSPFVVEVRALSAISFTALFAFLLGLVSSISRAVASGERMYALQSALGASQKLLLGAACASSCAWLALGSMVGAGAFVMTSYPSGNGFAEVICFGTVALISVLLVGSLLCVAIFWRALQRLNAKGIYYVLSQERMFF